MKALKDFFFENQCLIPMSFFQLPLQGLFTLSAVCLQFHVKIIFFIFLGSWFGILEMLPKLVEFGFSSDTRNFRRIQAVTLISTALHNPNLKGKLHKKLPLNTQKLPKMSINCPKCPKIA